MRPRPKVFLELPTDDYARLIGWGWDTIQEAHPFAPDGALVARLEEGKRAAQEARANGEGVAQIDIHGEPFLIHATGAAGGVAYRLENDDMIFLLRSASCEWGASVRFKAAGLWEHGWQGLRERAVDFFDGSLERKLPDEPRISRADYAFDFFSVAFSGEFDFGRLRPLLVCHSSSKARWQATKATPSFWICTRPLPKARPLPSSATRSPIGVWRWNSAYRSFWGWKKIWTARF